jgi:hypothetical protein
VHWRVKKYERENEQRRVLLAQPRVCNPSCSLLLPRCPVRYAAKAPPIVYKQEVIPAFQRFGLLPRLSMVSSCILRVIGGRASGVQDRNVGTGPMLKHNENMQARPAQPSQRPGKVCHDSHTTRFHRLQNSDHRGSRRKADPIRPSYRTRVLSDNPVQAKL